MSYFFLSNTYLGEYLGLEVHDQHLPGSNDKRALRRWWETGKTAWPGGSRGLGPCSLVYGPGVRAFWAYAERLGGDVGGISGKTCF